MLREFEEELENELESDWEAVRPTAPPRRRTLTIPPVFIITGRPFQVLNRFLFNSFALTSDHVAIIEGIACHVVAVSGTSMPVRTIVLQGHADSLGSADLNFQLGQRRSTAVQARLTNAINRVRPGLVATIQIVPQSSGKEEPIASGASPACRALNRRVEVFLLTEPTQPPPSGIAECVERCVREREAKLGRPMTQMERLRA